MLLINPRRGILKGFRMYFPFLKLKTMKKQIIILIALLISISTFAQQGINYKAVIKDGSGNLVANQEIDVKFSIIEDQGQLLFMQKTMTIS